MRWYLEWQMSDRLLTDIQHEEISLEELGHPIVYCKIKDLACVIEEGLAL